MRNTIMIFTIILPWLFQDAYAQNKSDVTFRPSANCPIKDFGSTELRNGGGFEATFTYRFMPRVGAYAGWGWNTFNPRESGTVAHFEETGYRLGMQWSQRFSSQSELHFLFSGGVIMNHIETENDEGKIIDDSGHGIGWETEAALSIPLNARWQIVPGIRYHALSRSVTIDNIEQSGELKYLSIGVGVCWALSKD